MSATPLCIPDFGYVVKDGQDIKHPSGGFTANLFIDWLAENVVGGTRAVWDAKIITKTTWPRITDSIATLTDGTRVVITWTYFEPGTTTVSISRYA